MPTYSYNSMMPPLRQIESFHIYQAAAYFYLQSQNNIIGNCGISNSSYGDRVAFLSADFMARAPDPKLCSQCIKIWHAEQAVVVRVNGRSDLVSKLDLQVTRTVMIELGVQDRNVVPVIWQSFPCE